MNNEDALELLDELLLKEKEHAIFVVNDHDNPSSIGGSHWSLLIYRRVYQPHFLVVDSLPGISANRISTHKVGSSLCSSFFSEAVMLTDCKIWNILFSPSGIMVVNLCAT